MPDHVLTIRLPMELLVALDERVRRASEAAGAKVTRSAVLVAMLRSMLMTAEVSE